MTQFYRSKVAEAGHIVIPAELRKELGITEGSEVVFSRDAQGVRPWRTTKGKMVHERQEW
jgi:AbrB family looped-hinge helix DNA binding protein